MKIESSYFADNDEKLYNERYNKIRLYLGNCIITCALKNCEIINHVQGQFIITSTSTMMYYNKEILEIIIPDLNWEYIHEIK